MKYLILAALLASPAVYAARADTATGSCEITSFTTERAQPKFTFGACESRGKLTRNLSPTVEPRLNHIYLYRNTTNISLECGRVYLSYIAAADPGSVFADNCIVNFTDNVQWPNYTTEAWNDINLDVNDPSVKFTEIKFTTCRFVAQAQMETYTSKVFDCRMF